MSSRMKSSLRRWIDITIYAVVAALVALPLATALARIVDLLLSSTSELPRFVAVLPSVIYVAILAAAIRQTGIRFTHFRYFHSYPPMLLAIPLGLWGLVALLYLSNGPSRR